MRSFAALIPLYCLLQLYGCTSNTASDEPVEYELLVDQALQALKRGIVAGFETTAFTGPPGLYPGSDSFSVRTDRAFGRHYIHMVESPALQAVVRAALSDSVAREGRGLGCFIILVLGDQFHTPSYSLVALGVYGKDGGVVFGSRIDSVNNVGDLVQIGPIDSIEVVRTGFSGTVARLADSIASLNLTSYLEGNVSPVFYAVFTNGEKTQFPILGYSQTYHIADPAHIKSVDESQHARRVVLNAFLWNIIKRAQPMVRLLPDDGDKDWMLP